jgi:ELWxxDGT repeat protein
MRTLALLWLSSALAPTLGQVPVTDTLVADLNQAPVGGPPASQPSGFIGNGHVAYFAADLTGTARELWISDGTAAGTRPVTDNSTTNTKALYAGSEQWGAFVPGAGDRFVFASAGVNPTPNFELYVVDSLGQPASLLKDISPGVDSGWPRDFVEHAGWVYFLAREPASGYELWRTDGTPSGTQRTLEFLAGTGSIFTVPFGPTGQPLPAGRLASNGPLLLAAGFSAGQLFLYATDGTSTPTLVAQWGGVLDGLVFRPDGFARVGNRLLFAVNSNVPANTGIWVTDGSAAGTQRLLPNGRVRWARSDGNRAFISVLGGLGGLDELFVSDGTPSGTVLLAGGNMPITRPGFTPGVFLGNRFFFSARFSPTPQGNLGQELMVSDGTPAGTGLFLDLLPGVAGSAPSDFGVSGGNFYCFANLPGVGRELVRSDGTPAGTVLLQDCVPGPASGSSASALQPSQPFALYAQTQNGLLFGFNDTQNSLPWRVTSQGAAPLGSQVQQANLGSAPSDLLRVGDRLFFSAQTAPQGERELWWLDVGTGGAPQRVEPTGLFALNASSPVAFQGGVAFSGSVPGASDRYAVWWTAGGGPLVRLTNTDLTLPAEALVDTGALLYFFGTPETPNVGHELWRSDGTPLAATLLNLSAGSESTALPGSAEMVAFGPGVAFRWNEGSHGQGTELGISNGLIAFRIDIRPGSLSSNPRQLTPDGQRLFLSALSNLGEEVWVSDGSPGGTQMLIQWSINGAGSNPELLTVVGNRLIWSASVTPCCPPGLPQYSILTSDGTPAGTGLLKPGRITEIASDGALALFRQSTPLPELWRTDGTVAGTQVIFPFNVGPFQINGQALRALGPNLFALDATNNGDLELWISDGTVPGTIQVADSYFGPGGSNPGTGGEVLRVGGRVFFPATLPLTGAELHAVPFAATQGAVAETQGQGCGSAALGLAAGAEPRLGQPFPLSLQSAAPGAPVALYFDTDLAPLAQPTACALLLPLPQFLVAGSSGPSGLASFPIQLGTNPGLVGMALYLQGLVVAPGEPFLGLISLTNGLEVLIGP